MCITKWKEPIWKGHILYDSNYVTFWKKQNYKDQWLPGDEVEEEIIGRAQRIFKARKQFCMILLMHVIIHLFKCIMVYRMYTTKNHSINYGLWVMITCHCRFIHCNKCTTLVGGVDNGGGCACVGTENLWEISEASAQFSYETYKCRFKKSKNKNMGQF